MSNAQSRYWSARRPTLLLSFTHWVTPSPVCYACICACARFNYDYSGVQVLADSLEAERGTCAYLDEMVARFQTENIELIGQAEQFEVGRKELADQNKELVCPNT